MDKTDIARLFDQASDNPIPASGLSSADLDRYRPYVAHLDIPQARKDDMILAVRRVMANAVDRAFGDDPVQQRGVPADKMQGIGESAALPVIDLDGHSQCNEEPTLDDVFHRHALGETDNTDNEEKR